MSDFPFESRTERMRKLGRKHKAALASEKSVLAARLEREDIPLREWRRVDGEYRGYHYAGGRRPLERKHTREYLKKVYDGGEMSAETAQKLEDLQPPDRSADFELNSKIKGLSWTIRHAD